MTSEEQTVVILRVNVCDIVIKESKIDQSLRVAFKVIEKSPSRE
jgi:hypothetical protein